MLGKTSLRSLESFRRKLTSNVLISSYLRIFSIDVLVKGSGIILLPIYLRLMTQEEFGFYGYVTAVIGTFSLVFNMGMYAAQTKLYHDYADPKSRAAMLGTINILLSTFIALLLVAIVISGADYTVIHFLFKNPFDYSQYRISVLLGVIVAVYSLMMVNFFLTSQDLKSVQIFNLIRVLLINSVVILLLWIFPRRDAALMRLSVTNVAEFLIIAVFLSHYIRNMSFSFDRRIALKALRIALPIMFSAVLGVFINLSDRYFLEKFGTLNDLSIYNATLSIGGVIPFVFASFQNIWLPEFLKEKDYLKNHKRATKVLLRLLLLLVGLSIFIFLILKVMLLVNIIDAKYNDCLALLPFVLATGIIASLTTMFSNHLVYLDKLYLIIVTGVPVAVLSVVLNTILVQRFNTFGAAISSMGVNLAFLATYALMSQYFFKKTTSLS